MDKAETGVSHTADLLLVPDRASGIGEIIAKPAFWSNPADEISLKNAKVP